MISSDRDDMRPRILLTGATGLLGEYLLRDLLVRGMRLAVVVRPSRSCSAQQRVETICHRWERLLGRALPRPVVLAGELTAEGWGLVPGVERWIADNCDTLLHNAASLQFVAETRDGEPWRSNLAGTERMLELAERWRIRRLHHVSTAYVCGLRQGRVLETEIDVGQRFGNDYEASKCAAELLVADRTRRFESVTVLRPAIITGDYRSGYTSTFHGFYAPLKIAASLLNLAPSFHVPERSLVESLGLAGAEEKNFVPVDWVAQAIVRIVLDRQLHGRTYHLTAEHRTACELLAEVMHETFAEHVRRQREPSGSGDAGAMASRSAPLDLGRIQRSFRDQMEIYRAYWRDDPRFDRTHLTTALPDLPPPAVDRDCIRRLCQFALRTGFGWPRPPLRSPPDWSAELLGAVAAEPAGERAVSRTVDMRVLGEGGGDFHMEWPALAGGGGGVSAREGWATDADFQVVLSNATLRRLVRGELTLRRAIERGGAVCSTRRAGRCVKIDDRWIGELQHALARRTSSEDSPIASGRSIRP